MERAIQEIKEWLQQEHDRQNFQRDHQKTRGDLMASILLKKMKELGLIDSYDLLFRGRNGNHVSRYKIRHVGDDKIRMSCSNCDRNEPESDEIGIYCSRCEDLKWWKNDILERVSHGEERVIERLSVVDGE